MEEKEIIQIVYDILGVRNWSMDFDENGEIISCIWSDSYRKKMGYKDENDFPNELDSFIKLVHEDDRDRVVKEYWDTVKDYSGKTLFDSKYRILSKDGTLMWFHSAGRVKRREDGSPISFIGVSTDITEQELSQAELKEQYEIVEALSRDYLNIFMVDVPNKRASIVKLDGYVTEGFGDKTKKYYPYEPFCRKYIKDRVFEEDKAAMIEAMDIDKVKDMLKDSMEYVYSYRAVDNGEVHFYQFTYTKLTGENSNDKVIAGFKNIDTVVATAKEKEEFKHLSEIDIMTNVYNRGHGEKLAAELVSSGECGMFCIFDMDNFKNINDTYGHNVGDKVLIEVAKRLNRTFRKGDIVFRLGGDEFAVAATGVSDIELARSIIERFFSQVEKIKIPEMKGSPISISAGGVLFENLSNKSFEELYTDADACVYSSKNIEGNVVKFFGYDE